MHLVSRNYTTQKITDEFLLHNSRVADSFIYKLFTFNISRLNFNIWCKSFFRQNIYTFIKITKKCWTMRKKIRNCFSCIVTVVELLYIDLNIFIQAELCMVTISLLTFETFWKYTNTEFSQSLTFLKAIILEPLKLIFVIQVKNV